MNCTEHGYSDPENVPCPDCVIAGLVEQVKVLTERALSAEATIGYLKSPAQSCLEERSEGKGGCGACSVCCGELRKERDRLKQVLADALKWCHQGHGDFAAASCGLCAPLVQEAPLMPPKAPPVAEGEEHKTCSICKQRFPIGYVGHNEGWKWYCTPICYARDGKRGW